MDNAKDKDILGLKYEPKQVMGWHEYFLRQCLIKAERSPDKNTKYGCIFVRDNREIISGYNGFPSGADDSYLPKDRSNPMKYRMINHAEMSAILFAAKEGISLKGSTLICLGHPCSDCCKNLVSIGVTKWIIGNRKHSKQDDPIERALCRHWMSEFGVNVSFYDLESFMWLGELQYYKFNMKIPLDTIQEKGMELNINDNNIKDGCGCQNTNKDPQ